MGNLSITCRNEGWHTSGICKRAERFASSPDDWCGSAVPAGGSRRRLRGWPRTRLPPIVGQRHVPVRERRYSLSLMTNGTQELLINARRKPVNAVNSCGRVRRKLAMSWRPVQRSPAISITVSEFHRANEPTHGMTSPSSARRPMSVPTLICGRALAKIAIVCVFSKSLCRRTACCKKSVNARSASVK